MPSVRSWHRSASFDSDSSKLNSGRESMSDLTRRDVLKAGVAATAVAAGGGVGSATPPIAQTPLKLEPDKGAKLRMLRSSQFVHGDWDKRTEMTKKITERTS